MAYIAASLTLLVLAFVQNVSFSIVSRNRNNMKFHMIAAVFSNGIWFLTFRELVTRDMSLALFPWYCIGTVAGSLCSVKISMWIEAKLGAESDSHIKPIVVEAKFNPKQLEEFSKRLRALEERFPDCIFDPEALLGGPSDR